MSDNLSEDLRGRIQGMVEGAPVLLFMKGTREQPQCGFSAQVVQLLDRVVPEYQTVDVLEDQDVREGIKEFSDWPTIPQLYVDGEFQGGCDIVREMYANGELHQALGRDVPDPGEVTLHVSDEAAQVLAEASVQYGEEAIHLGIDARFQHSLAFGPPAPESVAVEAGGLSFFLDRDSASRAHGLSIDVKETPQGPGLLIDNPNAPDQEG